MRQHRQSNSGIFGCDDWLPGSNSGFKEAVGADSEVFKLESSLRLLLSDFPVRYGDVRSVAIGAFNSKRAPWNSWRPVRTGLLATVGGTTCQCSSGRGRSSSRTSVACPTLGP